LKKIVIISVTSDLVTDQRVHRTASFLDENGFIVVLIGRVKKDSFPVDRRSYKVIRFNTIFEKGPLFYAFFNIRLFWYLLFSSHDILVSNDLDTLPANFLVSRIKKTILYYDSHEYFTEVPELISRPFVRYIWLKIEAFVFPRLKNVITVNQSIASIYQNKYRVNVHVVRNVPFKSMVSQGSRTELKLPENPFLIFQGAGINIDRGAEEAILSLHYLENISLVFVGGGDVIEKLRTLSLSEGLSDRVYFMGRVSFDKLRAYTAHALVGLSLDKDTNLNYRYSLPNKLFDYIHAGIPVLASDLPEVSAIINQYDVGMTIREVSPQNIGEAVLSMINSPLYEVWKKNTLVAREKLSWELEKLKLLKVFESELDK
jgi:glycosyltransferase involved in cell wall biosynthesis